MSKTESSYDFDDSSLESGNYGVGYETGNGAQGLIHTVVYQHYLEAHPAPEEAEYYLCGPPLMSSAVVAMLEDLGVDRNSILYDDFGA